MQVVTLLVSVYFVVLRSVYEAYHIGILLYGARLAQVTKLRAFTIYTVAALYATVELTEGNDWYVKLLCKGFEIARDNANFLFAAAEIHTCSIH